MRWISLILLFLTVFITYADKVVIGFAAEPLMKEFSIDSAQWGLVGSSFSILLIVTSFIGGTLSDRVGTYKMIFFVLAGVTIVQFSSFAIVSLPMLILYRVLLGAVEGPGVPAGMSHISRVFPTELRGRAISIFVAGGTISGIISAPILVNLIEKFGWRWTFVSLGFVSLIIVVFWVLINRNEKKKQKFNTTPIKKIKWSDISPVLRNPACFLTIAISAATYWLGTWLALWSPVYLTKVLKLAPMKMAYVIMGTGIVGLVLVLLISAISDRIFKKTQSYRKARVWIAGISTIIGGLALALIPLLDNSFLWVFIALGVAKGTTYINVSMAVQVMIKLMPDRAGFMSSILHLGNNITSLISPIITGILVQAAGVNLALGFNYSIYVMAGLCLITAMLYLLFVKPDNVTTTPSNRMAM
ncbi:MFS transporter [Peribacillus butanolivorans]|uniref:MFS transporter n=1 Tax=Peribacillus butanolivorans TaxID=421767 RepID=UPI0036BED2B6